MANYQNLKAAISAAIKTNGNQEITGQVLQDVLNSIVSVIGANYTFAGVATPATNPGTPDQNVMYLAMEGGTYTNFNGTVLPAGISLLMWNGTWRSETVMYGDGGVFDISVYKSSGGTLATFADLAAALDGGNNIPASARKGGMSVKYVQSSDNKYVQYRLMANQFSTTPSDWQGVDEEPTAGSKNLVESYGVVKLIDSIIKQSADDDKKTFYISDDNGNVILEIKGGKIKTRNFDSDKTPNEKKSFNVDFAISDEEGNVVLEVKNGELKTKNFNSERNPVEKYTLGVDFVISDEDGNVILKINNGNLITKNFNSQKAFFAKEPTINYSSDIVPVIDENSNKAFISVTKLNSTPLVFDFKWVGAVVGLNGKIYAIPNGNTSVLEIDPVTGLFCTFGNVPTGSFKWTGGVVDPINGLIYCLPRSANSVLIINPSNHSTELINLDTNYGQDHHYGGCLYMNRIYLAPRMAGEILVINTDDWSTYTLGKDILTTSNRYVDAILHPNGYIYFIPEVNAKLLKLNPETDVITEIGNTISQCNAYGAKVDPVSLNIYGFSAGITGGGIIKIDVGNNDTFSVIHSGEIGGGFYGTIIGMNGKMYSVIGGSTDMYEYDPQNDILRYIATISDTDGGNYNEAKCAGGAVAADGTIYMVPAKGRFIYKLTFDSIIRTLPNSVLSSCMFSNY